MDEVVLRRGDSKDGGFQEEPELWSVFNESRPAGLASRGGGSDLDAPLDLRVAQPSAIDLRKLWALTKQPIPPAIAASLGPNIPILLSHVVTPFANDGRSPRDVWGLGYEFILDSADANTVSVVPNDEVLRVGEVNQTLELGLQIGGGVGIPDAALEVLENIPAVHLTGAKLEASTNQRFQLRLQLELSLRKVVGAPVGEGGALWKMYRQNERLDRPHTLIQTLLVRAGTDVLKCRVRTWAKQAGWLGTQWGARFWPYEDQAFDVSLAGLAS